MSRQSSIPVALEPAIVRRWVEGSSPRQIARWLDESNATRREPIATSPSSVLRCIERAVARQSSAACLASVHRARMRSAAMMDRLEEVDDGYLEVVASASNSNREYVNHRINARLKALGKLELSAHRQLKLAGVGGDFGNKLAETYKNASYEMSRDIAAEDELEDAGIAPEITVRHLPPELFPPAPLTPEIMFAMHREQRSAVTTLSESEPRVSQPIATPNRNSVTRPVMTSTPAPAVAASASTGTRNPTTEQAHHSSMPPAPRAPQPLNREGHPVHPEGMNDAPQKAAPVRPPPC